MVSGERIRFRVSPRDVPAVKAARRLHLTLYEFEQKKEDLFRRGFPHPDPTTGMFDLVKIDAWMDDAAPPRGIGRRMRASCSPAGSSEVWATRIRYLLFLNSRWRWRPTSSDAAQRLPASHIRAAS